MAERLPTLPRRSPPCPAILEVLTRARSWAELVALLMGEAGFGKTTMLNHGAAQATDALILRMPGLEAQSGLDGAGLVGLCEPLFPVLAQLPERYQEAVATALGLTGDGLRIRIGSARPSSGCSQWPLSIPRCRCCSTTLNGSTVSPGMRSCSAAHRLTSHAVGFWWR